MSLEKLKTLNSLEPSAYLLESKFCNFNAAMIRHTAETITASATSNEEKTIRLFQWVQDNIRYDVGLHKHTATETFLKRYGSCTNKANLLVGLLRSIGIPAAFRFYRVKTREYFGPLCTSRLTQFMSQESIHVFAAVYLEKKWMRIDPTDDHKISEGGDHLNPQCVRVKFDGKEEALLNLNPEHIVFESHENLLTVDEILTKETRLSHEILWVMNAYLNYIRSHGKYLSSIESFEKNFFEWLTLSHFAEYEKFLHLEDLLRNKFPLHKVPFSKPGEMI